MKILRLKLVLLLLVSTQVAYTQYCEVKIMLCEEIKQQQEYNLYRIWFAIDGDTVYAPHIYGNIYYVPQVFCDARNDSTKQITMLFETYEYIYVFENIYIEGRYSPYLYLGEFCVKKSSHRYHKRRGHFTLIEHDGSGIGKVKPGGIGIKKSEDWQPFKAIEELQW